ncbi:MAG: CcmD family protein [Chloroflexi bacterium]|jgi:CcmD family protein|nr:CcmD family protein [Chloroflexota bacterium]
MLTLSIFLSVLAQTPIDDPNRFNQYLLLAYAVMWLVAMAYLFNVANKQRNLRQEIRLMRRLLEEDEARRPE